MMNSGKPSTPGHGNDHLEIWFKATKSGKRAYYFSTRAGRAMPLARLDAELWIATGQASEVPGHPLQLA